MGKYCIIAEVKPEYLEEYKRLHRALHTGPYQELLRIIKESGVQEEAVFMHGTTAIIFYETDDLNQAYKRQGSSEVAARWNKLMAPMFASSYEFNVSDKLAVLEKVFDLTEQLAGRLNP